MAEEEYQEDSYFTEINTKMRDLEEKQRILKDRTMLIGENLLELKESLNEDLIGIKKGLESLKQQVERLKSFLETASEEFSKFARKEDLEILSKQAKMFQPFYSKNNQISEQND
jgi:predicted  nucleic acid-binding Zn-ribbon protein